MLYQWLIKNEFLYELINPSTPIIAIPIAVLGSIDSVLGSVDLWRDKDIVIDDMIILVVDYFSSINKLRFDISLFFIDPFIYRLLYLHKKVKRNS